MSGSGPVTETLADDSGRRRMLLDAVAVSITRCCADLSRFTRGEVAQLHYMALELAAATNRALADRDEPATGQEDRLESAE